MPYFLQIALQDSEDRNIYVTGGQTKIPVYISGIIKIEKSEISVFDSDLGSVDVQKKYAASTFRILFLLLTFLITFLSTGKVYYFANTARIYICLEVTVRIDMPLYLMFYV